jgi:hypothetical protein
MEFLGGKNAGGLLQQIIQQINENLGGIKLLNFRTFAWQIPQITEKGRIFSKLLPFNARYTQLDYMPCLT